MPRFCRTCGDCLFELSITGYKDADQCLGCRTSGTLPYFQSNRVVRCPKCKELHKVDSEAWDTYHDSREPKVYKHAGKIDVTNRNLYVRCGCGHLIRAVVQIDLLYISETLKQEEENGE